MTNIHDYLRWRGDLTAAQTPFNEVDALILAKLAYIPFEIIELRRGSAPVTVGEAAAVLLARSDLAQRVHFEDDIDLLRELASSARFCDMRLSNYIDRIDEGKPDPVRGCHRADRGQTQIYFVSRYGRHPGGVERKLQYDFYFPGAGAKKRPRLSGTDRGRRKGSFYSRRTFQGRKPCHVRGRHGKAGRAVQNQYRI